MSDVPEITLIEIASALNAHPDTAKLLEGIGVEVVVKPKAILLMKNGKMLASGNVKMGIVQLAMKNKLQPASKQVVRNVISAMIKQAGKELGLGLADGLAGAADLAQAEAEGKIETIEPVGPYSADTVEPDEYTKLDPSGNSFAEGVKLNDPNPTFSTTDAENVMTLASASELFQPVGGTSSTSVYFCIALGPDFNVAARITKEGNISIRAEGFKLAQHHKALERAGLASASNGHHWSCHMKVDSNLLASKVIGAMLFGMEQPFSAVAINVTPIIGHGAGEA